MKYYKFLSPGGIATNGNGYHWPLPTKNEVGTWVPGKWTRKISGDLQVCRRGYHYTDAEFVSGWIDAELYEIEIQGNTVISEDAPRKYACKKARLLRRIEAWDEKTARLFAVKCAIDALSRIANPDPRSINACDVADRYAEGQATRDELAAARAAAGAAAWDAAGAAAGDAALDAAWDAAREKQVIQLIDMIRNTNDE